MEYYQKKIIIVGGSGFIGTQLALRLQMRGAHVVIMDPRPSPLKNIEYIKSDLQTIPDFEILQKPYIVFNLAGVPIFGKWNKKYKELIKSSRINTTHNLVEKFKNPLYRPRFFVSTSAIGVYGDRGDEILHENSSLIQNTYLAQVSYDWEQEALKAQEYDVEVRIVRNGHVLGNGGILDVMKKIFKWGIGGFLGSGKQYMSFVSIQKSVEIYIQAPFVESTFINAVSVEPLTNKKFSKTLARQMKRPCLFRIPVFAIRLLYGDFGKEIITSQRVYTIFDSKLENIDSILKENI